MNKEVMKLIITAFLTLALSACVTIDKEQKDGTSLREGLSSISVIGSVGRAINQLISEREPQATRIFADARNYPPENYAAYGIVAFNSRAPKITHPSYSRYLLICEAYVASIPHRSELKKIPTSDQMVTVWPVEYSNTATRLNSAARSKVCDVGIQKYDLATSLTALSQASAAGANVDGTGPFLLAWSPATNKGKKDVLVLVKDLSLVSTREEAINVFVRWRKEIESDPSVWESGWNLEKARSDIRQFVDLYGPKIAELIE